MRAGTIMLWLAIALSVLLAVVLVSRGPFGPASHGGVWGNQSAGLLYLILYAVLIIGGSWAAFRRAGAGKLLRYAVIWLAIGGAAALLYMVTQR